ncbi:hypothetical protein GWK47_006257 [Chionoecetes opilio]|uniref:Uncharacterized protein n=1 Tax=Chionoecetes opilio TaxID=41210 RepID=A0A8J4YEA9_CHIOP|nr:hypothetical protein GWK47_006257 [Chionoecetes opilio]
MLGTASGARPAPTTPPHTPTPEAEEAHRLCSPREAPAPTFLLRTRHPQQKIRQHRVEGYVRQARGEPGRGGPTSSPPGNCRQRGNKRGRDTAAGTDGGHILHAAHAGPARAVGPPRLRRNSQGVLAAGHCPPRRGRRPIFSPIPSPGSPPSSGLSPHQLPGLNNSAERMVLSRLQVVAMGALHPHVFGFTRGSGSQAEASSPCDSAPTTAPVTVFLDLRKSSSWPVITLFRQPREERGSGEDCSPGLED